jgi:hypothetical protein
MDEIIGYCRYNVAPGMVTVIRNNDAGTVHILYCPECRGIVRENAAKAMSTGGLSGSDTEMVRARAGLITQILNLAEGQH